MKNRFFAEIQTGYRSVKSDRNQYLAFQKLQKILQNMSILKSKDAPMELLLIFLVSMF